MKVNIVSLVVIFCCLVISVNALRSISESYGVGLIYDKRKVQLQQQYIELIKKKNELDYINTPFFAEKQLRESLNYYKAGEKLVVFTQKPAPLVSTEEVIESPDVKKIWLDVLFYGVSSPRL